MQSKFPFALAKPSGSREATDGVVHLAQPPPTTPPPFRAAPLRPQRGQRGFKVPEVAAGRWLFRQPGALAFLLLSQFRALV